MGLILPRWAEYHPQSLFFTQHPHTSFRDMYVHKTPPSPPKNPFSWPELESGQNEMSSGQFRPQLGKISEMWAKKNFILELPV